MKYLSVLAIAAIFSSCSSEGPAGPQGPTGATGANGVANIFTQQFTVNSWTPTSVATTWIATFTESDITDNNNVVVEAYWSNSSSGWLALPFSSLDVFGDQLNYGYDNGSVTFSYYGNNNPPSSYSNTSTIYFKVTVIPPSIQQKYPNVNWQNSSEAANVPEVKAALNNSGTK